MENSKEKTLDENGIPNFNNLASTIQDLRKSLVGFTQALCNTYYSSVSDQEDLANLRSNILNDSLAYSKLVVPICKFVFSEVHSSFDLIDSMDSPDSFLENLAYLIEIATDLEVKVNLCKELHEETIISFEHDKAMAHQVLMKVKKESYAAKDELDALETKKQSYEAKQKDGGSTLFERLFAPLDYLTILPVGSMAGKFIDVFANEYDRRKISQLASKAVVGRGKTELLFLINEQIQVGILDAIKDFLKNLFFIVNILNAFKTEFNNIQKRSQGADAEEAKKKLKLNYNSVKASCVKILNNSVQMQSYFDICASELRAFKDFEGETKDYELWLTKNGLKAEVKDLSTRLTEILSKKKDVLSEELKKGLSL